MLHIAMTGASGFVGRQVLPQLLASGYRVRVLARNPADVAAVDGMQVVQGDLGNKPALFDLTAGVDVVLHLAGAIKAAHRQHYFDVNADGTRALAEAAKAGGAKRFVYVSSLSARQPSLSSYGASKRAGETALDQFSFDGGTLILRPAAVYGPGDMGTYPLLKALMQPIAILPGRSGNRFSAIHVSDLAAICVEAVASSLHGLREVDDGSGGYTWENFVQITQTHFGLPRHHRHLPYAVAAASGFVADMIAAVTGRAQMLSRDKVRELYEPDWLVRGDNWPLAHHLSLGEGLPETIRWYQARGLLRQSRKANDRQKPLMSP